MSGLFRSLPLPPGGFLGAWAADPARFPDLLPDPFAAGAVRRAAEAVRWEAAARVGTEGDGATARPRREVAAAILATTREWGGDEAAVRAAGRVGEPEALAVVTGQQPGLFGGPLYSLVKAVSTVAAAREIEAETGRPTVPLFWIEGDDHDFEEIRTAWVLDAAGEPQSFRYCPEEEAPGLPAFRRVLEGSIEALVGAVGEALPRTEFTEEALGAVAAAYAPGRTLVEAFGRLLLALTRGTGLAVLDPTGAALKEAAAPMYRVAAANLVEGRRRIEAANARLAEFGLPAQAATEGYGIFSTAGPDGRRRKWNPGAAGSGGASPLPPAEALSPAETLPPAETLSAAETLPPAETLSAAETLPPAETLSAAVLLRPLVQDFLLPTAAYVGGPSELAYHAQIGGLYALHGLPRPLVLPRHQVAILTAAHRRVLDRDGIAFDDLSAGDESALNRLAADPEATAAIANARGALDAGLDRVETALAALDPTLTAAARKAKGRMLGALSDLESKALRSAKRRDEDRRRRFHRARAALFPAGVPQERRLGPAVFTNRYGPDLAAWLLRALSDPTCARSRRHLLLR